MPDDPAIKPLKSASHHWWPRPLSSFWANDGGKVHRIMPDGTSLASPPASFGAISNHNHIRFSPTEPTVWDETFEPSYDKADCEFAGLVGWLQTLSSPIPANGSPFAKRLSSVPLTADRRAILTECLSSLVVRSPSNRSRVRLTVEEFRAKIPMADPKADDNLIGANVRHDQQKLSAFMARRGKFAILQSGDQEFIFGDGFLHNFWSIDPAPLHARCLVPLTPEIAVFYTRPGSYSSEPRAFLMNLRPEEVAFVNRTVQIYASQYLLFREIYPHEIDESFKAGKHLEIEYNVSPWLKKLEGAMEYF